MFCALNIFNLDLVQTTISWNSRQRLWDFFRKILGRMVMPTCNFLLFSAFLQDWESVWKSHASLTPEGKQR